MGQTAPLFLLPTTKLVAGKLTCMEYDRVKGAIRLPLVGLAACTRSFCGLVGVTVFCYLKISLKLCGPARRNSLMSQKGCPWRGWLPALVVLGPWWSSASVTTTSSSSC